jgi:hypothetical protein
MDQAEGEKQEEKPIWVDEVIVQFAHDSAFHATTKNGIIPKREDNTNHKLVMQSCIDSFFNGFTSALKFIETLGPERVHGALLYLKEKDKLSDTKLDRPEMKKD